MDRPGFALFDTLIGRCGIAWRGAQVIGVQLPEDSDVRLRERMSRSVPDAAEARPPSWVVPVIASIQALLAGEQPDLSDVPLDMSGLPPFRRRIYELARAVPPGQTVTYGELARRAGAPGTARAVGQALGRNPFAIVVPCHRVVAANGRTGGFSANGGVATKVKMLELERAAAAAESAEAPPATLGMGVPARKTSRATRPALPFDGDAAVSHLRTADPVLGRHLDRLGPFELQLKAAPTVFAMLAEAIVYQQLSGKAAATVYGRVCALEKNRDGHPTAAGLLCLPEETLRGAGLSRAKTLAIRDLAERADRGILPTMAELSAMDDEAIVAELTKVRGIGRWSAEMFLIFCLGRPDVLPLGDYGVRKAAALLHRLPDLPDAARLAALGESWRPYRTAASWYLWRAVDPAYAEPDIA